MNKPIKIRVQAATQNFRFWRARVPSTTAAKHVAGCSAGSLELEGRLDNTGPADGRQSDNAATDIKIFYCLKKTQNNRNFTKNLDCRTAY